MTNSFYNKVGILADLWSNYKEDKSFRDFIEYNDLGLPLAYFIDTGLVVANEDAKPFIHETYELLLASLDVDDEEYTSLDEMMDASPLK